MKFLSHDGLLYFWKKVKVYVDTKYNELFQSVSSGKTLVASAITDKGITTDATATCATMASNIDNISTGVETYDATAFESDVLTGKTFYKDNVKKTGTMNTYSSMMITGDYNANKGYTDVGVYEHDTGGNYLQLITRPDYSGYMDGSTAIKTWITNLTKEKVQAGVVFGATNGAKLTGTYTSDGTAVASDILSGKVAYVKGSKITGTSSGQSDVLNFPLSIQETQPTGVRNGHIWIKSSTLASKITSASIQEALNAGVADNSLQFVVGETATSYLSLRNTAKKLTSGGNSINLASTQNNGGNQDWLVTTVSNVIEYKLNRPMVYSKIGGVLDIETSYMWNGSSWVLLCEKGSYVFAGSYKGLDIYNKINDTLTKSQSFKDLSSTNSNNRHHASGDGRYIIIGKFVYKRTGDTYSLYQTLNYSNISYTPVVEGFTTDTFMMSYDGTRIIAIGYSSDGSSHLYRCMTYKDNGTSFVPEAISPTYTDYKRPISYTGTDGAERYAISRDGRFVSAIIHISSRPKLLYWFISGTTIKSDGILVDDGNITTATSNPNTQVVSFDGNYVVIPTQPYGSATNNALSVFNIDYTNSSVTLKQHSQITIGTTSYVSSLPHPVCTFSDSKILVVYGTTPFLYTPSTNKWEEVIISGASVSGAGTYTNLAGDRLISTTSNGSFYYMAFDRTAKSITLISKNTHHTPENIAVAGIIPY